MKLDDAFMRVHFTIYLLSYRFEFSIIKRERERTEGKNWRQQMQTALKQSREMKLQWQEMPV